MEDHKERYHLKSAAAWVRGAAAGCTKLHFDGVNGHLIALAVK